VSELEKLVGTDTLNRSFPVKKKIKKGNVSRKEKQRKEKSLEKAIALEEKVQVKALKKKRKKDVKERWKTLY
jgi:hypothetical protein